MAAVESDIRAALQLKDDVLDDLADQVNVAQFVSFAPGERPAMRHVRVRGLEDRRTLSSVEDAVQALFDQAADRSVNVRSFQADQPKSNEFIYGLTDPSEAVAAVRRLARSGLYTIVNETIDVHDGGVSGVSYGGVLEFAPEDTPRCVEKPGTLVLDAGLGRTLLRTVYGFEPELPTVASERIEFSIHPIKRGLRHGHTIIWECERAADIRLDARTAWPNRFSCFIGDKAFGLLMADALGLPVPRTTVIARKVAPFSFGRPTGTSEPWIRTAPTEQVPGKFTTARGWRDPFALLAAEDPDGSAIAAVLAQDGIAARYAGAVAATSGGQRMVEGVAGFGDRFMQGEVPPELLPSEVTERVRRAHARVTELLGPARFEWVDDGETVWIVQLHRGALAGDGATIFPGKPTREHRFDVVDGLPALREVVGRLEGTTEGVVLVGFVGLTSHFGDVLRRAGIPSRIEYPA